MTTLLHTSVSVRWMLNWTRAETKRRLPTIKRPDGLPYRSVDEFREGLMDALANGTEFVPIGEPCEGFSPKSGCPGNEE